MNRKLMVLAVAGALSAPGLALAQASSVQIYGSFSYGMEMRGAGGGDTATTVAGALTSATASSLRGGALGGAYLAPGATAPNFANRTSTTGSGSHWGIRGREDLGRGMYAAWQIETGIQGDAVTGFSTTGNAINATYRNTGLWLGTPIGEFGSGHWDTPYTMIANTTGVHGAIYGNSSTNANAAIFGGLPFASTTYSGQPITQTCNAAAGTGLAGTAKSCFGTVTNFSRRQSNTVWYQSPNWSGFSARAQYHVNFPDSTNDIAVPNALKTSIWGLSGTYSSGPLYIGLGYETHKDLAAFGIRTFGTMVLGTDRVAGGAPIAQFVAASLTGSENHAWNINARYSFPMGLSMGIYYEKLNYSFDYVAGAAASNVTSLDKSAYRLDAAYQTGPHTIGLTFNKAGDIGGATIGAGFNGTGSGVQSWQLGYGYSLSKRTSVFGYYSQVTNDTNAQSAGIVFNGLTPAVGGDPRYYGVGMRHAF